LSGAPPGACQCFPSKPLPGLRVRVTARQGFPDRELERYHGNQGVSSGNFSSDVPAHRDHAEQGHRSRGGHVEAFDAAGHGDVQQAIAALADLEVQPLAFSA